MLFSFTTRAGSPQQHTPITVHIYYLFLFSLPTGPGLLQQREPITVGPYYLSPCQLSLWEETGVPGENPQLSAEQ